MNPAFIARIAQILLGDGAEEFIAKIADNKIVKAFHKAKAIGNALDLEKQLNKIGGQLVNAVLKMPKNTINKFIDDKLTKMRREKSLKQDEAKIINDFTKKLRTQKNDLKKNTQQAWNDYLKDNSIHHLSSSWIKYGKFDGNKNGFGVLTIWIFSEDAVNPKWYGPYTYPGVNIDIWLKMRYKQGKRGNGAGTVFWRDFLKGWFVSELRKQAYEHLNKTEKFKDGRVKTMIDKMGDLNKTFWSPKNYKERTANFKKHRSQHDNPNFKKFAKVRTNIMKQQAFKPFNEKNALFNKQRDILREKRAEIKQQTEKIRETMNTKKTVRDVFNAYDIAKRSIAQSLAGKNPFDVHQRSVAKKIFNKKRKGR